MYRLGSPSLALSARLSRSPYPLRRHTALLHTTARLANRGFDVDEVVGPAAPGQDDTRQPGFKEKVKRDRIQAPKPNKPIDPVTRQRYTSANTPRQWDMSDRRTWRKPQSESAMVQGNKVVNNHARLPRYGTRSRFDPDHDVASGANPHHLHGVPPKPKEFEDDLEPPEDDQITEEQSGESRRPLSNAQQQTSFEQLLHQIEGSVSQPQGKKPRPSTNTSESRQQPKGPTRQTLKKHANSSETKPQKAATPPPPAKPVEKAPGPSLPPVQVQLAKVDYNRRRAEAFESKQNFDHLQGPIPKVGDRDVRFSGKLNEELKHFDDQAIESFRKIYNTLLSPERRTLAHCQQAQTLALLLRRDFEHAAFLARRTRLVMEEGMPVPPIPTLAYDMLLEAYICVTRLTSPDRHYPQLQYNSRGDEKRLSFDVIEYIQKRISFRQKQKEQRHRPDYNGKPVGWPKDSGHQLKEWADYVGGISVLAPRIRGEKWEIGSAEGIINIMTLFHQVVFTNAVMETSTFTLFIEALSLYGLVDSGESQLIGDLISATRLPSLPLSPTGNAMKEGSIKRPRGIAQAVSLLQVAVFRGQTPTDPCMYNTLLQACTQVEEPGLALYVLEVMQRNKVLVDWETVRSIMIGTNRAYLSCVSSSSESDLAWYRVSAMLVHDAAQALPLSMAELLLLRPLSDNKVPEGYTWVRHLPDQPPSDPTVMTLRNTVFWAALAAIANDSRPVFIPGKDASTDSSELTLTEPEHQELLREYVSGCLTLGDIDSANKALSGILKPISAKALQFASASASLRVPSEMVPTLVNTYIRGLFLNGEWYEGLYWLEAVIKHTQSEESDVPVYGYKELVQYTTKLLSAFFHHYPDQYTTKAGVRLENTVVQYYQTTGETVPSDTVTDLVQTTSIVPTAHATDPETRGAVAQQLKELFTLLKTLEHEPIDPRALLPVAELLVQSLEDKAFGHAPVLLHGLVEECIKGIDQFPNSRQDRTKIWNLIAQAGPALITCCLRFWSQHDCWTYTRAAFTRLSELGDATYSPSTLHALQYTIYRLYLEARRRAPSGCDPEATTSESAVGRLLGSNKGSSSLWTWIMGTPPPPEPPALDLQRALLTLEDFTALTHKSLTQLNPLKRREATDEDDSLAPLCAPDQLSESPFGTDEPIDPPYPWLVDTSGPVAVFRQLTGVLVDLDEYTPKHSGLPAVPLVNYFPSPSSTLHMLQESTFAALQDAPIFDRLLAFDEAIRRNQIPLLKDIHKLMDEIHGLARAQLRWIMYLYQAGLWALRCRAGVPANVEQFEKGFVQLEQHMLTTLATVGRPDLALLHYRRLLAQRASVEQSTYLEFIEHVPKEKDWLPLIQHLFQRSLDNYPVPDPVRTRLFLSWFGTDPRIRRRAMDGTNDVEVLEAAMQAALWQEDVDAGLQIHQAYQSVARQSLNGASFMDTALLQLTWKSRPEIARSLVQTSHTWNIDMNGNGTNTVSFNRLALRVQDQSPNLTLTHTYVPDIILHLGIDKDDCWEAEQLYQSIPERYGVARPSWDDTNALMQVYDHHQVPVKKIVELFKSALAHGIVPPSDANTAAHVIRLVTRTRSPGEEDEEDQSCSPNEEDKSPPPFDEEGLALAWWIFGQMRKNVSKQQEYSDLMEDVMLAYASGTLRSPPSALESPSGPWAQTIRTPAVKDAMSNGGFPSDKLEAHEDLWRQVSDDYEPSEYDPRIPGIDVMDEPPHFEFNPEHVAAHPVERVFPSHDGQQD